MDRRDEKLKRVLQKLDLTFRDVEQASRQIAARRGSDEFIVAGSRLADIENKGRPAPFEFIPAARSAASTCRWIPDGRIVTPITNEIAL